MFSGGLATHLSRAAVAESLSVVGRADADAVGEQATEGSRILIADVPQDLSERPVGRFLQPFRFSDPCTLQITARRFPGLVLELPKHGSGAEVKSTRQQIQVVRFRHPFDQPPSDVVGKLCVFGGQHRVEDVRSLTGSVFGRQRNSCGRTRNLVAEMLAHECCCEVERGGERSSGGDAVVLDDQRVGSNRRTGVTTCEVRTVQPRRRTSASVEQSRLAQQIRADADRRHPNAAHARMNSISLSHSDKRVAGSSDGTSSNPGTTR